jgi:hypothetical protein
MADDTASRNGWDTGAEGFKTTEENLSSAAAEGGLTTW